MKLVTFTHAGISRIGALKDDKVIDLNASFIAKLKADGKYRANKIADAYIPTDMRGFLEGGNESLNYAKDSIEFALSNNESAIKLIFDKDKVKFEAPITNPKKIICVGHNYREHILEMGREIPPYPLVFAKFANTVIGPEDDIPFYPISKQLDYEAEFTFVVGKRAKNIAEEDALDYVAGYTVCNDITYRDLQRRTLQWLQGKSVDGAAPMGPWLITSDELKDPSNLEISLTVNGEERQRSNTKNLVFSVQRLLSFLSKKMTLEPGDVIMTGTPGGVGVAMEPQSFLKDGDVVRVEVENVGVLENKVVRTELE